MLIMIDTCVIAFVRAGGWVSAIDKPVGVLIEVGTIVGYFRRE